METQTQETNTETENKNDSINGGVTEPVIDEREMLKNRARLMGIEFGNNTSTDTLKRKIQEKLDGEKPAAAEVNPLGGTPIDEDDSSPMAIRRRMREEQMRLVRVRVTCLDPKKKDLPGEIFTIANEFLGTVSKFVPFGEVTDDGYHIPFCIYTMMNERKFLNIRTRKDKKNGQTIVEQSWAKEFALEILPQLTPEELKRLATAQMAAGSIDNPSSSDAA